MNEFVERQHQRLLATSHKGREAIDNEDDDVRQMAPLLAELDPEDWEHQSAYEEQP